MIGEDQLKGYEDDSETQPEEQKGANKPTLEEEKAHTEAKERALKMIGRKSEEPKALNSEERKEKAKELISKDEPNRKQRMLQEDVLYTRDKVTQFVAIFEIILKNQDKLSKTDKEILRNIIDIQRDIIDIKNKIKELKK